ncbi:uncharacterized protein MKZ38_006300 [Zalerion maritima]|uniref:Uncharacterized protein n=1 Tax=Zalerion maritima TaxID=339359 RepID=A0AAD5RP25_9PEZI|nr:uncharacterized protein MKZ38_006300 [Zalerion maritima]
MGRRPGKPTIRILLLGGEGVGKGSLESRVGLNSLHDGTVLILTLLQFTTMMYPPSYDTSLTLESRRYFTLSPHPPSPTCFITRPLNTSHGPSLGQADLSPPTSSTSGLPLSSAFSNHASRHRTGASHDPASPINTPDITGRNDATLSSAAPRGPCSQCVRKDLTFLVELVNYPLQTKKTRLSLLSKRDYDAVILLYSIDSPESLAKAESLHAELSLRPPNTPSGSGKRHLSLFGSNTSANTSCGISDRELVVALLGSKADLDIEPGLGIDVDELMSAALSNANLEPRGETNPKSPKPSPRMGFEPEADAQSMDIIHPLFRTPKARSSNENPLSPLLPADSAGRNPFFSSSLRHSASVNQRRDTGSTSLLRRAESASGARGYGEPIHFSEPLRRNDSIRENPEEIDIETPGHAVTRQERSNDVIRRVSSQTTSLSSLQSPLPLSPSALSPLNTSGLDLIPSASASPKRISTSPFILNSPQIASFSWQREPPSRRRTSTTSFDPEVSKSNVSSTHRSVQTSQSFRGPPAYTRKNSTNSQYGAQSERSVHRLPRKPSSSEVIESWLAYWMPAAVADSDDTLLGDLATDNAKSGNVDHDEAKSRNDDKPQERRVSKEEAEKLAHRLMLSLPAMECSSKTGEGVDEAFEFVIREVLKGMKVDVSGPPEKDWTKACPHRAAYNDQPQGGIELTDTKQWGVNKGGKALPPARPAHSEKSESVFERIRKMFGGRT